MKTYLKAEMEALERTLQLGKLLEEMNIRVKKIELKWQKEEEGIASLRRELEAHKRWVQYLREHVFTYANVFPQTLNSAYAAQAYKCTASDFYEEPK